MPFVFSVNITAVPDICVQPYVKLSPSVSCPLPLSLTVALGLTTLSSPAFAVGIVLGIIVNVFSSVARSPR